MSNRYKEYRCSEGAEGRKRWGTSSAVMDVSHSTHHSTLLLPCRDPNPVHGSNIVLSKYARDAQVAQAEFVKSSVRTEDCPADGLPEFALVGRSNVGKSSLMNSLCSGLVGTALGKGRIIPYLKKPWAQAELLLRTNSMRIVEARLKGLAPL
ncbi:hypothetical protein RJ640_029772 [Escallonia rubra]|uniref:G domain-containing protein n=1 Tax=Escallonia rubra TaxID=112253 RepID=A0AA88UFE9_9ASTE|nr:hypothetical protein RJ640_029772 [Escallonia rubra]